MLHLHHLAFTYLKENERAGDSHARPVLGPINVSIAPGEWVAIVGAAGAGKSTLCRLLCGTLQASRTGELQGKLMIAGRDMTDAPLREYAGVIGAVFQDPENGLVMEMVEDELAFGPENRLVEPAEIDRRIDEALIAVGMPDARVAETKRLSGGQMQRIAIASMLTMKPQVFVLDDAEANLDSPAREQLIHTLRQLHQQGHTIITASPRLAGAALAADRVLVIDQGSVVFTDAPSSLIEKHRDALAELGCVIRNTGTHEHKGSQTSLFAEVNEKVKKDGGAGKSALQAEHVTFGYPGKPPVLHDLSFTAHEGELLAILGPNGTGKTTLGKLIVGLLQPMSGTIRYKGRLLSDARPRIGYVFQQPDLQFVADTVYAEIAFSLSNHASALQWLDRFDLAAHQDRHPLQLSLAEKRLVNLAAALAADPELLILDEITAGLDYRTADQLIAHVYEYTRTGKIVLFITHDHDLVRSWNMKTLKLE